MSDYTPTTEEIREYVEMGGEQFPWLPPTPEKDALRAAAFDRWLAAEHASAAERAWREGYYTGKRDYAGSITGGMPISSPNPYGVAP